MSFDKKKSVRLAGVVLSGSLILSTSLPVAAQGPGTIPETASHQTEEKTEKVVFLNTVPSADGEKQGPYDGQAVHSMEEVLALLGEKEEEGPQKFELLKEETKILVLCGETHLSEEEMQAVNELGILLMADTEYEALQKAKEEAEKKEAEEKAKEEADKKEADQKVGSQEQEPGEESQEPVIQADPAGTEEPPAFLWEAPQVIISASEKTPAEKAEEDAEKEKELTSDETSVDAAGEEVKTPETSGILLPGFSAPSGETEEKTDETNKEEAAEAATENDEDAVADETADSEDSTVTEEEETEEVAEEEVVYTLFALFNEPELVSETADAEALNMLVADNEIESEEQQVEIPSVLALPGTDLVGGGTSGVGGGSKPSSSGSSTGSSSAGSSTGSSSSGNTSTGSASTGTSSGNTSAAPSAPSTPAVKPQTTVPSKNSVIQTGDSSNRTLWGLTAGISGAMAAYFAVQWRKLKNALSK